MRAAAGRSTSRGAAFAAGAVTAVLMMLSSAPAGAQNGDDPADLLQGMEVFNAGCSSCHQADGSGSPSGRSLIDIAAEQPDRAVHVASVTEGIGNMPAYGDRLTESEIDAAVTYLRLTFVSDGSDLDELPNTGGEGWTFALGLGLVALGASAVATSSPSRPQARSKH